MLWLRLLALSSFFTELLRIAGELGLSSANVAGAVSVRPDAARVAKKIDKEEGIGIDKGSENRKASFYSLPFHFVLLPRLDQSYCRYVRADAYSALFLESQNPQQVVPVLAVSDFSALTEFSVVLTVPEIVLSVVDKGAAGVIAVMVSIEFVALVFVDIAYSVTEIFELF